VSPLSKQELVRYARHFPLPHFGIDAQQKLKQAKVLVVGAGGLGCPALLYLTAAGVGEIAIADFDLVSESNLQRQILYTVNDIGKPKATVACERLKELNPLVLVHAITEKLTTSNAMAVASQFDLILDASDNFPTRYLLNDASILLGKPLIYGSVYRYEGQLAVFNYQGSATYRDLYPSPPEAGSVPTCEQGGVLGVLPGLIGSLQANEAIKVITGIGKPLAGMLLLFDSLTLETIKVAIADKNQRAAITKLIDYDDFCGIYDEKFQHSHMQEITVQELKSLKDANADFQLIDVREPHEYDLCEIGGELIPMAEVPYNLDRIARDKQVIVHCRSGKRSGDIIQWLEKNQHFTNLYNLKGGILAWAKEIDTSMPTY
jgi:molybdopterin/thiamine biosynthesis adenylyltransferase/rhodanese-related sulfurtransferase